MMTLCKTSQCPIRTTQVNYTPIESSLGFVVGRHVILPTVQAVGELVYPIFDVLRSVCRYAWNGAVGVKAVELKTQHWLSDIKSFDVEVEKGWSIYVEESGNPDGIPVVFVHGGPGAHFKASDHRWFDPEKYRIIAFQQRGTYKCSPSAEDLSTNGNLFKDIGIETLAKDMEVLREHLCVEKWLVFGGSWGSTLGLYYAEEYPNHCSGLIIRGIFLSTEQELADFYTPEKIDEKAKSWNRTALERLQMYAEDKGLDASAESMTASYRKMIIEDNDIRAAELWRAYEKYIENDDPEMFEKIISDCSKVSGDDRSVGLWETQIFNDIIKKKIDILSEARIQNLACIPIKIVQGSNDPICPPVVAKKVVEKLPFADFSLIEGGRHSPYSHPCMIDALVRATDQFALNGKFS